MRWVIGIAAFLAPVVIVMSAMAQTPSSGPMLGMAQGMVQEGAALLIERIADTIGTPHVAVAAIR